MRRKEDGGSSTKCEKKNDAAERGRGRGSFNC